MIKKLFVLTLFILSSQINYSQDKISENIQAALDSVWKTDQEVRFKLIQLQQSGKMNTEEFKELVLKMKKQDSLNLIQVKSILDKGWPNDLNMQGNQTLFLVIQHADLETQKRYLPTIEKAVNENKTLPSNLALLQDRIALREGKKQIYGSQVYIDSKTGEKYVQPLQNPEKVDSLRSKVGLPPMQIYLQQSFQMNWDLEKYYEDLPKVVKLINNK